MKSSIGHIATINSTKETGLVIGEIHQDNTGWKVQLSLDNKSLVVRINTKEVTIHEIRSLEFMLERLIRDIKSDDLVTRQWTSEVLCNFIEECGSEIDFTSLKSAITNMVDRISIEEDYEVGQNLSEGIFEFVYLNRLGKNEELELVTKLAKLDKDYLHAFLNDDKYLQIKEVRDFIMDKTKWWNRNS